MLGQIGATLDRDQLLKLVTEHASSLLGAEQSSVFLADASHNGEAMLTVSNPSQKPWGENTPVFLPSEEEMHSFLAESAVAVPLRTRPISVGQERGVREERIIGNLMAINKKSGNFDAEDTQLLEIMANQASTVLQIAELYADANELFLDFIKTLASTIDAKDPYTRGHSQRVSDVSVAIAKELDVGVDMIHDIRIGSLLHDLGKIGVPDHILTKPARLTNKEFEYMKKHPGIGYNIMSQVHLLQKTLPAIVEHHERLDGSGYPFGLRNEQISLIGRIVAVADVFDALSTDRPYREAWDIETVFDYLEHNTGSLFAPECVQALISAHQKGDESVHTPYSVQRGDNSKNQESRHVSTAG
jgi:HD-GYP domain-containing protein (c-di-GMP phosphodiesterase class II)